MVFKVKDYYFKKAKKENYVARSVFKLEEIDKKYNVLRSGDHVVDFGYHPGSWIQYTSKKVGNNGLVVGIDIKTVSKKIAHLKNVQLYMQDIFGVEDLKDLGVDDKFDVVLSDMAPNTTGIKTVDQLRSLNLVEKVFDILPKFLKPNGNLIIKVFDSNDAQVFLKSQKKIFSKINYLKPKSTRSVSKEFFVVATKYKG